jgi:hypothetical protein
MILENEKELYIPLGIKLKRDKITGFGVKEIFIIVVIFSITLIVASFYYSISRDSFGTVLGSLIVGGSTLIILRKNETNQSVLDLATHLIKYLRSQKKYQYHYLNEWE